MHSSCVWKAPQGLLPPPPVGPAGSQTPNKQAELSCAAAELVQHAALPLWRDTPANLHAEI